MLIKMNRTVRSNPAGPHTTIASSISATAIFIIIAFICAQPKPALAYSIPVASDYYLSPSVSFGEKLLLEFNFGNNQGLTEKQPDLIFINLGSFGNQTHVQANLYLSGRLVDTQTYTGGGLLVIYRTANSAYIGLPSNLISDTDFGDIISGTRNALLEIKPFFANTSGNVTYSGWGPHASKSNGPSELTDIFPSASIIRSDITPLSAPVNIANTIALLGIGVLSLIRNKYSGT